MKGLLDINMALPNRQGMSRLREVTNTVVSLNCREREFDKSCGEKKLDEV